VSRRRGGCLVALLVLLLLVGAVLVVVDRVAVGVAEDRVAEQVADRGGLTGTPEVDIAGFPFLTQALAGDYRDVRVHLTAEELGQPAGTRADVALRGVHVPLSDVLSGSVQQIPVDRVDGTATLSYGLLAEQVGGDTTLARDGAGIRVTRTVEVLGFDFPVTATGTLTLDGQDVVIDVQDAEAGAVDVPDSVVRRAADLLDLRYPVPELPFGLELTSVRPGADGVQVRVAATDTVLSG
jgi:LmeA-like phospholipid-binding